MIKRYISIIIMLSVAFPIAIFSEKPPEVGFVEKLGDKIPMGLTFTDASGQERALKEIVDRPTILALVYYRCPGICSPLLSSLGEVADKVTLEPGEDFRILTISFDHSEGPELAKKWKDQYLSAMQREFDEKYWDFMVGDSASIRKLSDAVGFYFKPDGKGDFIHAGGLMILDKEGKISRYLLGTTYLPFDVKMSLIEASKGRSIPTVSRVLEFCFSYDPEGKTYVFNITKVAGTIIFVGIGIFFAVLLVKGRSKKAKKGE